MIKVIHTNYRKLGNWRQRIKNKNKLWLNVLIILWCTFLWRRQWHPTPVLLPGKSHGWRAWWAAVHGVSRSRTRLSDFTLTFHFHALEEEMATHSNDLAWRIPWTEEPDGLPSMGLHRVGHDWSDLAAAAAALSYTNVSFYLQREGIFNLQDVYLLFKLSIIILVS